MDLGIDFGTSYVTICAPGTGVLLHEPSVIALNSETGHIVACGREANEMRGRAPESIQVICPLDKGVIADYEAAELLLRHYVGKVCSYRIVKPRAVVAVPLFATEVERRSLLEAVSAAGMRRVTLLEGVLAAAIGAGLPVGEPHGSLVVNLGGGATESAVVSLMGVASTVSLQQGGNALNDAIIRYLRSVHAIIVGDLQAERLKQTVGSVLPFEGENTCTVSGRQALSGLPVTVTVTAEELRPVICREVDEWLRRIGHMMEQTPPDLLSDVYADGITLTGGGALLHGLAPYAAERLNAPCRIAPQPDTCVGLGAAAAVQYIDKLRSDEFDVSAFSYHLSEKIIN